MQENKDFSTTFLVDNTPDEAFAAISNPRGWWSQAIEGDTDKLGAEFEYHYQDVHRTKLKITEFVPGQKVVWHVLDNYFNFIKDKNEWIGTDIVFEIAKKGDKTEVRFTHLGLEPLYECYDICSNAWGTYIGVSLRELIITGKGQPNPVEESAALSPDHQANISKARQLSGQSYTTAYVVDQSPEEVYAAINNVRGWWTGVIEGSTDKLGAEFKYSYEDIHHSTQKVTELAPSQKVVWHVVESQINFVKEKREWEGTDIVFEITKKDGKTELRVTHVGLVPAIECYGDCTNAWHYYLNQSLFDLITTGKGAPNQQEQATKAEAVAQ